MKFRTITKYDDNGRTILHHDEFNKFPQALHCAKEECQWESVIESIVVCTKTNEILWEGTGDFQFAREVGK